jgi:hypothetical protein
LHGDPATSLAYTVRCDDAVDGVGNEVRNVDRQATGRVRREHRFAERAVECSNLKDAGVTLAVVGLSIIPATMTTGGAQNHIDP